MKLTIWGAARQVTGSMHLLEVKLEQGIYKILIDCGLNYENRESRDNANFPFEPEEIDLVVLTHAHIDHSGNLPTLIKSGFSGQIISTMPTSDLSYLLMSDSVNIFMSKQQAIKNSKSSKKKKKAKAPLYLQKEVEKCMEHFFELEPNKTFEINTELTLKLIPVGHLLGAMGVLFTVQESGREKTIFFSGDVGRVNYPVLEAPQAIPPTDYLVCESTYGGRQHSKGNLEETLVDFIKKTCIDQPGRLIIPAFSVGRTQALVYSLNKIFSENLLPPIKVFVDSPLGVHSTEIYRKHRAQLNDDAAEFYRQKGDEFEFDNLIYVEDIRESKRISTYMEPCIIVSSAGMLEGGRIQDHLYHNIQNFYCTILFIGYCAKGTLGRRLLDGELNVRINNRDMDVYAHVASTDLLSAHADHNELIAFIKTADAAKLKRIFLVHGEVSSMEALAVSLTEENYEVEIPAKGVCYEID